MDLTIARRVYGDTETLADMARRPDPFGSAQEAWFWTSAMLAARRDAVLAPSDGTGRAPVCDPDEVLRCLDQLYRRRRIDLAHARVLRIWGMRQREPDPAIVEQRGDWKVWREAMDSLEWALRVRGIVAGGVV